MMLRRLETVVAGWLLEHPFAINAACSLILLVLAVVNMSRGSAWLAVVGAWGSGFSACAAMAVYRQIRRRQ
jgi:hypothetical protein